MVAARSCGCFREKPGCAQETPVAAPQEASSPEGAAAAPEEGSTGISEAERRGFRRSRLKWKEWRPSPSWGRRAVSPCARRGSAEPRTAPRKETDEDQRPQPKKGASKKDRKRVLELDEASGRLVARKKRKPSRRGQFDEGDDW